MRSKQERSEFSNLGLPSRALHIFLIENDDETAGLLNNSLIEEGFSVTRVRDGREGLPDLEILAPDLIILDVVMPGMDGFEFCQEVRKKEETANIPILMLTAKDELTEKIKGFQVGADDYITKPFILAELIARIKVHLRLLQFRRGLTLSERQYRLIVENSPDGIISLSSEGKLLFHNNRFLEILRGKSKETFTGRVLESLFPMSDLFREVSQLLNSLQNGESSAFRETKINTTNQVPIFLELIGMPVTGATGSTEMYLVLIRDITERRKMEEALIQAEKINSLGILAAGIAHEVNNPLTGISNAVQLIKNADLAVNRRQELCNHILDNIQRIAKIVKDLHIFSRPHGVTSNAFILQEAVQETISLLKYQFEKEKITVEFNNFPKMLVIFGDKNHFQQVLVNLLVNAIQAIENGGKIMVSLEQMDKDAVIMVEDTGCGIPQDQLGQIFTPFFTTKRDWKGTGLGLAVSYRIIQLFKGTISVQTTVGKGSRFTVKIPLYQVPK